MRKITDLYHEYLPNVPGWANWYFDNDVNLFDNQSKAEPYAKKLVLFHAKTKEIFTVYEASEQQVIAKTKEIFTVYEASEQQVISNVATPEFDGEKLYFLVLDKVVNQILLMSYTLLTQEVREEARISAESAPFPRLHLYVSPVLLAKEDSLNEQLEIYYPKRFTLPLLKDESFECQEGDYYYFSKWLADESLPRRLAYVVKNA
ncbi:hypothetical protein [Enterococcus cecorum]|uniref:hypothetical protein n=1 Tax=Enterococcus cecorum TaxID=44008 RepID=UPI00200A09FA|nr:hypothetical protein [Enterococcus cecorum]